MGGEDVIRIDSGNGTFYLNAAHVQSIAPKYGSSGTWEIVMVSGLSVTVTEGGNTNLIPQLVEAINKKLEGRR